MRGWALGTQKEEVGSDTQFVIYLSANKDLYFRWFLVVSKAILKDQISYSE
jgi:hypothetical protein